MLIGVNLNVNNEVQEKELRVMGNVISLSNIFKNEIYLLTKINAGNPLCYNKLPNACIYINKDIISQHIDTRRFRTHILEVKANNYANAIKALDINGLSLKMTNDNFIGSQRNKFYFSFNGYLNESLKDIIVFSVYKEYGGLPVF